MATSDTPEVEPPRSLRHRAVSVGRGAGTSARKSSDALVAAVGALADQAIDRVLLGGERVTSAAEGKRLLAGKADTEALTENIQRVCHPRGAGCARARSRRSLHTGAVGDDCLERPIDRGHRAYRRARAAGHLRARRPPARAGRCSPRPGTRQEARDRPLSRPKRPPDLGDSRLRLVRLTRKWVLSGALGRKTSKRATRALDAAEKLDTGAISDQWASTKRSEAPPEIGSN